MFVIARAHPSHAVDCGWRRIRRMWGRGVRLVVVVVQEHLRTLAVCAMFFDNASCRHSSSGIHFLIEVGESTSTWLGFGRKYALSLLCNKQQALT